MSVNVINDSIVNENGDIRIHITYDKSLTLKELSETLDLLNKSINDFNRENGVKNNSRLGREYASEVKSVESGSIVLNLLVNVIAPVSLSVLANFIYDRVKTIGVNKKNTDCAESNNMKYPIDISVLSGDNNEITIHICNNELR